MLEDDRLTRHYEADLANAKLSRILGELVDSLSDLEYNLRILEIGAGTAGTTLPVLEALSRDREEPGFGDYTFTDISTGFFEKSKAKLSKWSDRVTFKKLDISQDPLQQGFEAGTFDVVIAANVLHATPKMDVTMTNVRSLLKPRGTLLLLEGNRNVASLLPFFLLPGWWKAEDEYRDKNDGPMIPVAVWNRLLGDTGFSGVDTVHYDVMEPSDTAMSVISSTRIGRKDENQTVVICGVFLDDDEIEFANLVADSVSNHIFYPTEVKPLAEIDPFDMPYYIFIDSRRESLVQDVSQDTFDSLNNLLVYNTGLLWVIPEGGTPESKLVKGMIRTLRIENEAKNLLILDDMPYASEGVSAIVKLSEQLLDLEPTRTQDQDFVWHNGSIHILRMRLVEEVKEQFAVEQGILFRKEQNIWDSDRALEMTMDAAGSAESIYYRRTNSLQNPIGDDEVVIHVEAAGVSQRDVNLILGSIPWSPPGFDGAGKVVKTGSQVFNVQVGDTALFLSVEGSSFSTYTKIPSCHVAKVPTDMSIADAATLPLAYSMAVLALIRIARLKENETVLIHSAAGAVGQASILLAQHLGARIFVTAGTEKKRDFLHRTFGIPKKCIFSSRTAEFRDGILVATEGKGVDVIVNSLGGELLTETWALAAKFGRFVEIDKKSAFQNNYLPMKPFDSNASFYGVDLRELWKHQPGELNQVFSEIVSLIQQGVAVPIKSMTTMPISQFEAVLRKLRSGDNCGKIVVTLGPEEKVVAESNLHPFAFSLNADATYLITGGTKGIGLNLAYWMIEQGARNVVVLGRSGDSGTEVQKLLKNYQGTDVTVRAVACDVGSHAALAGVVDSIKDLPPVRGVIHSALLLSDKLFENATYEDWNIITKPRIQGAWNLHELLPDDMDFFISLGSFLGDMGNGGQAIYAGTAVFYEAFANYRNARGQHSTVVALPVVLDVGYVASNNLSETLKKTLGATLTMSDIRTIVKGAIMGKSPFIHNGKAAVYKIYLDGQRLQSGPWRYIQPVHATQCIKERQTKGEKSGTSQGLDSAEAAWALAEDPYAGLTEALITKVAAMTLMERNDVGADTRLVSYGLDSLVSVELRNWIRRETAVELPLSAITAAESLRALATEIIVNRGAT